MRELTKAERKSEVSNWRRTAIKKIKYHVNKVLKIKPDGEKIRDYVNVFWTHYNIKSNENPKQWLYRIYETGENDIISKEDISFYRTREWRQLRLKVLSIYGEKCMKCGYEDKSNCVDHIKPRSLYKDLELEFDNMQVLCTLCNLLKSNKNTIDYRKYPIDERSELQV